MRNEYVTKRYIRQQLRGLLNLCPDEILREFIKIRLKNIENAMTKECRKYLYFDTIEILQNPYRMGKRIEMGINVGEPRIFI